jgi:hypothetical protein
MEPDEVRARVGAAFSDVVSADGAMVTRWVAMVEIIDGEGERAVYALSPSDARAWDSLGLLTYGIHLEQAAIVRDSD